MQIITTVGTTKKAEIKWIIRNFALDWASKKPGEYLNSPIFHAQEDNEVKWSILLYPYGDEKDVKVNFISLFLSLEKSPGRKPIPTKYSFTVYDENNTLLATLGIINAEEPTFIDCGSSHGYSTVDRKNEENGTDMLTCQSLSVICKIEYGKPKTLSNAISSSSNVVKASSLKKDIEQLFSTKMGTDVTFTVNEKEFEAHKLILSARSPVFAAMFNSDMKESVSNRVEITDIAPAIFDVLLRFIYTDQFDFSQIDVKDLLAAANRYFLPLLKSRCEKFLSESLTTKNCIDLLILADLHDASQLQKETADFFQLYRTETMATEHWKKLKKNNPELAFNLLEEI